MVLEAEGVAHEGLAIRRPDLFAISVPQGARLPREKTYESLQEEN